jgi:hypothetical protein
VEDAKEDAVAEEGDCNNAVEQLVGEVGNDEASVDVNILKEDNSSGSYLSKAYVER